MASRTATDVSRDANMSLQGWYKQMTPKAPNGNQTTRRIKEIKAALSGKSGFQSDWARNLLTEELASLKGVAV